MASKHPSKANLAFDWVLRGYSPRYGVRYPLPCVPELSYWRGSVYSPSGDKLLITYKERLASPKNTAVKGDSALSRLSRCQPQAPGPGRTAARSGGQKVMKRWHVLLAGLFAVLLQRRCMLASFFPAFIKTVVSVFTPFLSACSCKDDREGRRLRELNSGRVVGL